MYWTVLRRPRARERAVGTTRVRTMAGGGEWRWERGGDEWREEMNVVVGPE